MISAWLGTALTPAPVGEQTWQPKSDPRSKALRFGNFKQKDEGVGDAML